MGIAAPASSHVYSPVSLRGDYVRAACGLACTVGPLALVADSLVMSGLLGAGAILFLIFGVRTWARRKSIIELDRDGITATGLPTLLRPAGGGSVRLRWGDLGMVRLRFFSTRRDRSEGWMELSLAAGGRRVRLDSNLDGFTAIVARAAAEATANGLALTPATATNLTALGLHGYASAEAAVRRDCA